MSTKHERWSERLSEYVDGEMGWDDQAKLETHLSECATCASTLADLRRVVAQADGLEDRPLSGDLWSGVLARIESQAGAERDAGADVVDIRRRVGAELRPWQRRVSLSVPQLAAASVAMILMSAGAAWIALSDRSADVTATAGSTASGVATTEAPVLAPPPGLTLAGTDVPLVTKYETAIADLEEALRLGEGTLESETLATLRRSLMVIDHAIEEAREALAADPQSAYLNAYLADTMRRKVNLLRYANHFATAQI